MRSMTLLVLALALLLPSAVFASDSVAEAAADRVEEPEGDTNRVLQLDEAIELLMASSTMLAITDESIREAKTLEDQAYTIWYPRVNLTAIYTLNDKEVSFDSPNPYAPLGPYLESVYASDPSLASFFAANPAMPDARGLAAMPGSSATIKERHSYRLVGTVTQTLFNARAFPLLDMAEIAVERAENGKQQATYELKRGVIQLYFGAVTFKRLIEVSRRNVELSRLNVDTAQAMLDVDLGLKFEVNRAEVSLASAERELENARLAYRLALDALATFLETEPDFDVELPEERVLSEDLQEYVDAAVAARSEMESYSLAAQFNEKRIDEVDSRFWPVVFAQAQAMLQQETAFGGDPLTWSLTVQESWDLYDGGLRAVEKSGYEVAASQSKLNRELREKQVAAEVRQAWMSVSSERQKVASASAEVGLAIENVELTQAAQELNAATAVDVELAQRQRYLSEVALATAEVGLRAQIYALLFASGEL